MYYRGISEEFEVLKDIEGSQAVPGNESWSNCMQEINVNSSFYETSGIPTTCMNFDTTQQNVEMPSAVSVTSETNTDKTENTDSIGNSETLEGQENMGAHDFDILDTTLMAARNRSIECGSLLPLIKEELKLSIQTKRLKEGKQELTVDFKTPEPYMLTEEEVEKVKRRRVQNREAARRFRDREKSKGNLLQKECEKLEAMNTRLRYVASQLKGERNKLKSALENHTRVCPYRSPQPFYKSLFPGNSSDNR